MEEKVTLLQDQLRICRLLIERLKRNNQELNQELARKHNKINALQEDVNSWESEFYEIFGLKCEFEDRLDEIKNIINR